MIADAAANVTNLIAPGSPTSEKILRYAQSKGLQRHDADDVAQETALRSLIYAAKFPDRFRGEQTVVGIAKHCVVDEHRRRRQKRRAQTSYPKLDQIAEPERGSPPEAPLRGDVELQLGRFTPRTRETALRHLVDRESNADIANAMGLTESAVRSRLLRVRRALFATTTRPSKLSG